MPDISTGGGFQKVTRDLIAALNLLGKEVYLLSPFRLDIKKITDFYGPIRVQKSYSCNEFKRFFCKDDILARKIIKKEFQKMAKNVDLIIDMEGRILHNYLPKNSNKPKYIVWRVSPARADFEKFPNLPRSYGRKIKDMIKKIINIQKHTLSRNHKIYTVDNYTEDELIKYWGLEPEKHHLYPEVNTDEFFYDKKRKKNQIVVSGRIIMCKRLDDSVKIFAKGTKNYPDYELVIIGGATKDSKDYINYLKKIAKNLGVGEKVKIIENPPFEELKKVLIESKVLIDSEQGESTTITAIEALASGVIVLASTHDCGTWWEMLESGKWGFGFENIEEGGNKLDMILEKLEKGTLNPKKFTKRPEFYSHKNFVRRVKKILSEN